MENKKLILGGLLVVLLLAAIVGFYMLQGKSDSGVDSSQVVSTDDPVDMVLDFYNAWLAAVQSTSTTPYQTELVNEPLLSQSVRDMLAAAAGDDAKDPVLCQDPLPTKVNIKRLSQQPDEMQMVVLNREQPLAGQAIITTRKINDGWYIADIYCSKESSEAREFTFEYMGNLLKRVPPPYDPQHWHLVYSEGDVSGYAAPLYFSSDTICTDVTGVESVCDESQFTETQVVMVHGTMTELGVEVKRMELLE